MLLNEKSDDNLCFTFIFAARGVIQLNSSIRRDG